MGAIPDKVDGRMTYAQLQTFRMPWWADSSHMPNLISVENGKDVQGWLRASGMDFTVKAVPMYVDALDTEGEATPGHDRVPDFIANRRMDTGLVLGVVSNDFKVVQPHELISGFIDRIQDASIELTTMGSMKKGRNIFIGCKLSDSYATQVGPDLVEAWLMLHTRFDGKGATVASISSVCPVCENTVESSMSEATRRGSLFRVPHRSQFDGALLREAIEAADIEIAARAVVFNALVERQISYDEVQDFFARDILEIDPLDLTRTDANGKQLISARTRNNLDALIKSYNRGPGAQARIGTAWGAFQAVTNWVDNEASTRDTEGDGEHMSRKYTAMYGRGKQVKQDALNRIMLRIGVERVI